MFSVPATYKSPVGLAITVAIVVAVIAIVFRWQTARDAVIGKGK